MYVKFPEIFAHDVQICAKFSCKIVLMFPQYFDYYAIILGRGAFFSGHGVASAEHKLQGHNLYR